MTTTTFNIAGFPPPPAGTCHVTAASGSRIVHVSGQVGSDENGTIVPGGLAAQVERALLNVALAVGTAGVQVSDLVQMRLYIVGWNPSMWEDFGRGAQAVYQQLPFPEVAATLIGVTSLFTPEMLVEIDADAVIGSAAPLAG